MQGFGKGSSAKITYFDLNNSCNKFGAFIRSVTIMPKIYAKPPDYIDHRKIVRNPENNGIYPGCRNKWYHSIPFESPFSVFDEDINIQSVDCTSWYSVCESNAQQIDRKCAQSTFCLKQVSYWQSKKVQSRA